LHWGKWVFGNVCLEYLWLYLKLHFRLPKCSLQPSIFASFIFFSNLLLLLFSKWYIYFLFVNCTSPAARVRTTEVPQQWCNRFYTRRADDCCWFAVCICGCDGDGVRNAPEEPLAERAFLWFSMGFFSTTRRLCQAESARPSPTNGKL